MTLPFTWTLVGNSISMVAISVFCCEGFLIFSDLRGFHWRRDYIERYQPIEFVWGERGGAFSSRPTRTPYI